MKTPNKKTRIITKGEQKEEALIRMRSLYLRENIIRDFEMGSEIHLSFMGFLYDLTKDEKEMVKKWETETNNVVYHIIKNYFEFGLCYTFLYVSKHPDEWAQDREDLKSGIAVAYVKNITDEYCSEYGGVGIASQHGGLVRTA